MTGPLKPEASVLMKIGSIVVHISEAISEKSHEFDFAAIQSLLEDSEVLDWLEQMDKLALLPKKR
jgi:hypothetical protein